MQNVITCLSENRWCNSEVVKWIVHATSEAGQKELEQAFSMLALAATNSHTIGTIGTYTYGNKENKAYPR